MKLTKYSDLKHGMRVKGKIRGMQIDDMKVSIDEDGKVYLCQNEMGGIDIKDKLGYNYSYRMAHEREDLNQWFSTVTDLESIEGLRVMKVGDIVVDSNGDERKVLEVLENTFAYSYADDHNALSDWFTFEQVEKFGWKLKNQEDKEPEVTELTIDQIAERFGLEPEQVRIKKND